MLCRKDVAVLINNCSLKMNVAPEEVFLILCSIASDKEFHDHIDLWEGWREGKKLPEWFMNLMIDVMADRIPLVAVQRPAKAKRKGGLD